MTFALELNVDSSTNLLHIFFSIIRFAQKVRKCLKAPVRSKNRSYVDYWKASMMVVNWSGVRQSGLFIELPHRIPHGLAGKCLLK